MKRYTFTFTGLSPLIMHQDNIEWSERMKKWRENPDNKGKSVAGDDRSPPSTWLGSLYHDSKHVTMPSDNIMRCFMEGGAQVIVPGGKNGKTFKAQTQSGMLISEEHCTFENNGKQIDAKPFLGLVNENDFEKHLSMATDHGFVLFVKRARIGASKHVRVRPRFDNWTVRGTLEVWDDQLTLSALRNIARVSGAHKGLCDWRPGSKTPGPFGRFEAKIEEVN